MVEVVPGHMREVFIGKSRVADNHRHLYEQIVTYCRSWGNPDTINGRTFHRFKEITGQAPPRGWSVEGTPNVEITKNVLGKMRSMQIAYAHSRKRHGSEHAT